MKDETFVITGPTATGKTDIGIMVAREADGEIISADSRQIYKGFVIGTASPVNAPVEYHLINFLEPTEQFNAMRFVKMARSLIEQIKNKGKLPILVGGTGLYVRALCEGLFQGGGKDEKIRQEIRKRFERGENLWYELKKVDPEAAKKISSNDYPRIERALEVWYTTGKPITFWQREQSESDVRCKKFLITMDRERIYQRINERVERMFKDGWIEEVQKLLASGVSPDCPAFESVGYKEVLQYLEGEISLERTKEIIKRRTRNYARRQIIWFKKEPGVITIDRDELSVEEAAETIIQLAGISQ